MIDGPVILTANVKFFIDEYSWYDVDVIDMKRTHGGFKLTTTCPLELHYPEFGRWFWG